MSLHDLNEDLNRIVEKAGRSLVELRARRGAPSSGVAFSEDGLVLTAEHTVEADEGIAVSTRDGRTFAAQVVGRDPSTGIALLRTEGASLVTPDWRESRDVKGPELAIVVAFWASSRTGLRAALTIVNGIGGEGEPDDRHLETDAKLFAGFSGSLLLDAEGRALGMNTAGLRRRSALAIPAETLGRVGRELLEHGEVRRGFLGITTYPVKLPESVKSQRVGLLVLSVQEESPAARAGLFLGDVLLGIGESVVESPAALLAKLGGERIGATVQARILRTGREDVLPITVGARS